MRRGGHARPQASRGPSCLEKAAQDPSDGSSSGRASEGRPCLPRDGLAEMPWPKGNGNPLQCSCLENPRDGGAWWAAVSGVAQSRTRLKRLSSSSSSNLVASSNRGGMGLRLKDLLSHPAPAHHHLKEDICPGVEEFERLSKLGVGGHPVKVRRVVERKKEAQKERKILRTCRGCNRSPWKGRRSTTAGCPEPIRVRAELFVSAASQDHVSCLSPCVTLVQTQAEQSSRPPSPRAQPSPKCAGSVQGQERQIERMLSYFSEATGAKGPTSLGECLVVCAARCRDQTLVTTKESGKSRKW